MIRLKTPLMAGFLLLATSLFAQTYSLAPVPKMQFLDATGTPLAGGFVQTFAAGTTTPLVTYQDSAGTVNTDPIVLDAGGYANIWIPVRTGYKFCIANSSNVQQYCVDNIQNTQIGSAQDVIDLWSGPCNSSNWLRGDGACATPAGGGTLTGTLTPGVVPMADGPTSLVDGPWALYTSGVSDYLQMTTITGGVLDISNNNTGVVGAITSEVITSGAITAGKLYKIDATGHAVIATTADTTITVLPAYQKVNGYAQLFTFGAAPCQFDNSTTPGDIVVASTTQAAKCHDTGSTVRPSGSYVIGVVQGGSTGAGNIVLISPSYSPALGNVGTPGMTAGKIPVATAGSTIADSYIEQSSGGTSGPNYYYFNDPTVSRGSNLRVNGIGSSGNDQIGDAFGGQFLFDTGAAVDQRLVKIEISGTTTEWLGALTTDTDVMVFPVFKSACENGVGTCYFVQFSGVARIDDDSTGCVPGNIVVTSTSSAGKAHDTGATAPSGTVYVIGVCLDGSNQDLVMLTPSFH